MSKAPKIIPSVKAIVYQAAMDETTKDRKLLAKEIQERLKKLGVKSIPAEDTLHKMISGARNNGNDLEDKPWSVQALALTNGDIPFETLPVVMNAWAKIVSKGAFLTIRQVKWIARLSFVYKGNTDMSLAFLILKASEYANKEKAIKLAEAYPDKPDEMHWLSSCDAILYFDMEGKDEGLAKRLREIYVGPEGV